jgi:hypothetical protein
MRASGGNSGMALEGCLPELEHHVPDRDAIAALPAAADGSGRTFESAGPADDSTSERRR